MFLAKLIDQKQGEARVVDHGQVLRDRLDRWLSTRPSATDLAARGILGRGPRFAVARDIVDLFLRARFQAQAAEAARIPAGNFEYTDRVHALLADAGNLSADADPCAELEQHLNSVHHECGAARARLHSADLAWSSASEECKHAVGTGALRDAVNGTKSALQLLEAHRASTGDSLADVFSDLRSFQRLAAKRSCLEGIVAVVVKTDAIREAVFACRGVAQVPLNTLEELPKLCAALPSRSQGIGVRRLQFLISPLRTMIVQELHQNLRTTQQWPHDPKAPPVKSTGATAAEIEVIRLCASMQRVQGVNNDLRRRLQTKAVDDDANEGIQAPWACSALAAPLITWFRRLFQKPELCRMEKPEWAFTYIVKLSTDYGALLEKWTLSACGHGEHQEAALDPMEVMALKGVDLPAGLAVALACEVRLLMRARMAMLAEPEARPTLLHTLRHLVRFHGEIEELGGPAAAAAAFADFDENRPLHEPSAKGAASSSPAGPDAESAGSKPTKAHSCPVVRQEPQKDDDGVGDAPADASPIATVKPSERAGGMGFMGGLSHLKDSEAESEDHAAAEQKSQGKRARFGAGLRAGFSKLQQLADGAQAAAPDAAGVGSHLVAFEDNLLTGLTQFVDAVGDEVDRPAKVKPVGFLDVWIAVDAEFIADKLQKSIQLEAKTEGSAWRRRALRLATAEVGKEEPEVAALATLVADLFDKSRSRAECFATLAARGIYADRVLGAGLRLVIAAIRQRWNALGDPLVEAQDSAVLVETLEEICRFLDRFPLGAHFVPAVDETSTLRIAILDKLADSLVGIVRPTLRRLQTDSGCFSYSLGQPWMVLLKRLRPSNFLQVARKSLTSLGDLLLKHLLWHAPFSDREQMSAFISNCRDDLRSVLMPGLDMSELGCLRPLWDGCALLALPQAKATQVLAALRQVERCSPARALQSMQSEEAPESQEDFEPPVVGEVLRQRRAEVFAGAGIKDLSVPDAIIVLGKRPELVGSLTDLQDAPLRGLQDLMPVGAGLANLGAEALQHLQHAPHLPTAAIVSSASRAAGTAQAAASQVRKVQEAVGAELGTLLPGRLIRSVGSGLASLRPLAKASAR